MVIEMILSGIQLHYNLVVHQHVEPLNSTYMFTQTNFTNVQNITSQTGRR